MVNPDAASATMQIARNDFQSRCHGAVMESACQKFSG
jgi:hypothetical protein